MWASSEFGVALSEIHGRNVSSLKRAAETVYDAVGCSFSRALGNTFRQAVAGIFAKKEMDTEKMLKGHVQATVARCAAASGEVIVVSQDTTYYNLNSQHSLSGLGLIQGKLKGTLQHNALAMDQRGTPQGLIYQRNWTRGGLNAFDNESAKWEEALAAVNAALGAIDKQVVLVEDREADVFSFFCARRSGNVELVVRVCQPRYIEVLDKGRAVPLQQAMELLAEQGELETEARRNNRPVRLRLEVKAGKVAVLPPKDTRQDKARDLSLVMAREVAATDEQGNSVYDAAQAACWLLLTTCPVEDAVAAKQVVRWYALRWRVEQFHYVLKSGGFKVERLQFDDVHTFFNALSFYSIVAWRVLYLTYLVREKPQAPAEEYFEPVEVNLLQASAQKPVKTLEEAVMALGKLAGFQKTKKQPLPGAKLLGEALVKLQNMVEGWRLFETQQNNTNFSLQD
ncbi:DDE family transposase [Pontibacter ummariensis]|nr:IS4 family transposase [Pontibacter ummariensis]PRX97425.1 DDE family transposase [Pontibacter ummariensis]